LTWGQDYFSVGNWQDHLPYSKIKELAVVGEKYYASTPYSLIEVNNETNEITKYSTVNGLSETGISSIVANESQKTLVVAYESSNIDLIKDDQVINFSAILNSNIVGDKSVYEMVCKDRYVYVCTGFGIVVIDLNKVEVKDTYIIGSGNTQLKINDIHISNDSIFALTDLGIKCAPLNALFLSDANSWTTIYNPTNPV
jgi:RNase P/RNase MRP subunit p29